MGSASSSKRSKKKPKATCAVCHKTMKQVTPAHLATHGLTPSRYERMYGDRPPSNPLQITANDETLPSKVADRLLDDKVWLGCVSDEVGERMLNGPLRQRLAAVLVTHLHQRATVTAEAMTILNGALQELKEDWRLTHGGPDHGPTPTEDLLKIVDRAERILVNSETAIQRAIKLALDEQKAQAEYADGLGPSLYSGQAEKAGPLASLGAGDRENVRILVQRLAGHLSKRREPIDATVRQVPGNVSNDDGRVSVSNDDDGVGSTDIVSGQSRASNDDGSVDDIVSGEGEESNDDDGIGSTDIESSPTLSTPTRGAPPSPARGETMPSSDARQRPVGGRGDSGGTPPTHNESVRTSQEEEEGASSEPEASKPSSGDEASLDDASLDGIESSSKRKADRKRAQRRKAAASKRAKGTAGAQPKKATKKTVKKKAAKRGKKKAAKKRKPKKD